MGYRYETVIHLPSEACHLYANCCFNENVEYDKVLTNQIFS